VNLSRTALTRPALVVLVAAALAGCSGDDTAAQPDAPQAQGTVVDETMAPEETEFCEAFEANGGSGLTFGPPQLGTTAGELATDLDARLAAMGDLVPADAVLADWDETKAAFQGVATSLDALPAEATADDPAVTEPLAAIDEPLASVSDWYAATCR
jgi:hypothetical protein